jgi:hypothetical protein
MKRRSVLLVSTEGPLKVKQSTIVHIHQTNDRCQKEGEFEATSTSYHLTAEDGPHAKPSYNEIVINTPMEIDEVSDDKIFEAPIEVDEDEKV